MSKKKIMVVEDSPTDLHLIRSTLENEGYSISTAVDGEEALRRVGEEQPDLVLLDIVLPKISGFEVCRELKAAPETAGIKVIIVSSKKEHSDRFWGMKQGAEDYLTKPLDKTSLLEAVARHV